MQQLINVLHKPIHTTVIIPGSKSITNRALLLAALCTGESKLNGILLSDDTYSLLDALQSLGLKIKLDKENNSCVVPGCAGKFPNQDAKIFCRDAGTVARFMLAACANAEGNYFFDASERLRQRPLSSLVKVLQDQGVTFDSQKMPLNLKGANGIKGGEIFIEGNETSQFLSALLMVAPLAKSSVIISSHHVVSAPYVKMTCDMMAEFGVLVDEVYAGRYAVNVPQQYQGRVYDIEPDLSTASYFFAAAAVTQGEITIPTITRNHLKQADIEFLSVLEKMGCEVKDTAAGVYVQGASSLHGVDVNMEKFSDTFMTLAAIAPFATTPTTITGIKHTRLQESDRIAAMQDCLDKLNVKTESGEDWLRVYPSEPKGATLLSHHDHRIAMSSALIGLRVPGVVIEDAECVAKTCPDFFAMWKQLAI